MIYSLSANPDLDDEIKEEIIKIKAAITEIDIQVAKDSSVDEEFAEFAAFALDYTENLRKHWWDLPGEKLSECKQLLFRSKIIVQPSGNVYTPDLSYIYSFEMKNSDPEVAENRSLVELIENSLHSVINELERWQTIIGGHYIDYLLEQERNSLADKAMGYSTVVKGEELKLKTLF